jgi:hypothetical protein
MGPVLPLVAKGQYPPVPPAPRMYYHLYTRPLFLSASPCVSPVILLFYFSRFVSLLSLCFSPSINPYGRAMSGTALVYPEYIAAYIQGL